MNILTIDTVLDKTYIALFQNGKQTLRAIESDNKNYHSAYLIKTLKEINALLDIEYLGVNTGVGSFTGIRAGLSVAKIITERLNIKAVCYTTTELLAHSFKNKNIMLDARRGSAFYSNDGKTTQLIAYENALEIIENSNEEFICDLAFKNRFNLEKLVPYENKTNLAKFALEIAKTKINNGETTDFSGLNPTYIQTPPIFIKK